MVREVGRLVCEAGRLLLLEVVVAVGWWLVERFWITAEPAASGERGA